MGIDDIYADMTSRAEDLSQKYAVSNISVSLLCRTYLSALAELWMSSISACKVDTLKRSVPSGLSNKLEDDADDNLVRRVFVSTQFHPLQMDNKIWRYASNVACGPIGRR